MSDKHLELELKTYQSACFTIHYADYLAEFFFRANASSIGPNSYDDCVLKGRDPNRITSDDVSAGQSDGGRPHPAQVRDRFHRRSPD